MARRKANTDETKTKIRKPRPALTPEARENQLIALAYNAAEEQMLNGTASSQVITHFLKLGSTKAELEKAKLEYETKLVAAKTEAIAASKHSDELYAEVLNALREYSGTVGDGEDDYTNLY